MRNVLLTGLALACAASAFAGQTAGQTTTPTSTPSTMGSANKTMTIVGCVGGGASATDPFMLSNVSLDGVGTMGTAGNAPVATSSAPDHPTTGAMQPAGATGSTAAVITTGSTTAPVGTVGTAAGTAAAMPVTGTAPMAASSYRLSGYSVSGFRGQRVQMVGSLVEPPAATGTTTASTGAREFKVQSVQPVSGSCSQP